MGILPLPTNLSRCFQLDWVFLFPAPSKGKRSVEKKEDFLPDAALRNDFGYLTRKGAVTPQKNQEWWDLTPQSARKPNLFSQITKSMGNHDAPWKSEFPAWHGIGRAWAGGFRMGAHPGYGKSWKDPRRDNSQCWSHGFSTDKGWKGNKRQRERKEFTAPIWDQFLPYPHPRPVRECFAITISFINS